MDEIVQHKIALACIALLRKNAIAYKQASDDDSIKGSSCSLPSSKNNDVTEPKTKKEAITWLLNVANEPDITFDQVTDALWIVYQRSRPASQTRQWVVHLLLDLAKQEDVAPDDATTAVRTVCALDLQDSEEQQEAVRILLALANRRDILFRDTVEAAHALYIDNPKGSQARELGAEMLLTQARWSDVTAAQALEAALALAYVRGHGTLAKDWNRAIQVLIELAQQPDLSFEDAIVLDNQGTSVHSNKKLLKQQLEAKKQMWETVGKRSDLTPEQQAEVEQQVKNYISHLSYV
jgi:hypothetical protein